MRFLASLALSTAAAAATWRTVGAVRLASGAATYTNTETAVPFIISELPGERAEALFIAMAALVPTAGEHIEIQTNFYGLGLPLEPTSCEKSSFRRPQSSHY